MVKNIRELEAAIAVMRTYGMVLDKNVVAYQGMPLSFFVKVMLRNNNMPMHMFGEVYEALHMEGVVQQESLNLLKC